MVGLAPRRSLLWDGGVPVRAAAKCLSSVGGLSRALGNASGGGRPRSRVSSWRLCSPTARSRRSAAGASSSPAYRRQCSLARATVSQAHGLDELQAEKHVGVSVDASVAVHGFLMKQLPSSENCFHRNNNRNGMAMTNLRSRRLSVSAVPSGAHSSEHFGHQDSWVVALAKLVSSDQRQTLVTPEVLGGSCSACVLAADRSG
jgi:hypothetical protein